jgi:hypothetical protein
MSDKYDQSGNSSNANSLPDGNEASQTPTSAKPEIVPHSATESHISPIFIYPNKDLIQVEGEPQPIKRIRIIETSRFYLDAQKFLSAQEKKIVLDVLASGLPIGEDVATAYFGAPLKMAAFRGLRVFYVDLLSEGMLVMIHISIGPDGPNPPINPNDPIVKKLLTKLGWIALGTGAKRLLDWIFNRKSADQRSGIKNTSEDDIFLIVISHSGKSEVLDLSHLEYLDADNKSEVKDLLTCIPIPIALPFVTLAIAPDELCNLFSAMSSTHNFYSNELVWVLFVASIRNSTPNESFDAINELNINAHIDASSTEIVNTANTKLTTGKSGLGLIGRRINGFLDALEREKGLPEMLASIDNGADIKCTRVNMNEVFVDRFYKIIGGSKKRYSQSFGIVSKRPLVRQRNLYSGGRNSFLWIYCTSGKRWILQVRLQNPKALGTRAKRCSLLTNMIFIVALVNIRSLAMAKMKFEHTKPHKSVGTKTVRKLSPPVGLSPACRVGSPRMNTTGHFSQPTAQTVMEVQYETLYRSMPNRDVVQFNSLQALKGDLLDRDQVLRHSCDYQNMTLDSQIAAGRRHDLVSDLFRCV